MSGTGSSHRDCLRPGPQPPDHAASDHQSNRDQLSAAHGSVEHRAAAGIVAQEFEEEAGDAVDEHERAEDLAIEFPALEQPHEKEEVREFDREFKQLRGFQRDV